MGSVVPFDIFSRIARSEWDTLLFFYGVVMCVGGLGFMGYLSLLSETLYGSWNPVWANVVLGLISAVVDNIPVMFAVLSMAPDMSEGNWLLITLTAGVGVVYSPWALLQVLPLWARRAAFIPLPFTFAGYPPYYWAMSLALPHIFGSMLLCSRRSVSKK
ncbi:hypothetical protein HORIV_73130 [Vreelandella olivaria]|uniref:Citrate transporter-like domain-containing protein n=1 Tax=Vreelandella olivaria TaxID=390919 RepID=A0ABM7GVR7_9GAMM|nr:hypothetical protein HORIV_73130 [Halomonas olivaria]